MKMSFMILEFCRFGFEKVLEIFSKSLFEPELSSSYDKKLFSCRFVEEFH